MVTDRASPTAAFDPKRAQGLNQGNRIWNFPLHGKQDEVGRALRRSIERYNPWDYSDSDIKGLIKSVQFGSMGLNKYDSGHLQQIGRQNKQNVEWVRQLLELGR